MDQDEFAARVSSEAARLESEQTADYIQQWMQKRVRIPGIRAACTWDERMSWYRVEVSLLKNGTIYQVDLRIREEDVIAHSTSMASWTTFLDQWAGRMSNMMRTELLKNGITRVGTDWQETPVVYNGLTDRWRSLRSELQVDRASELEEAQAIESIKRTIAGREA